MAIRVCTQATFGFGIRAKMAIHKFFLRTMHKLHLHMYSMTWICRCCCYWIFNKYVCANGQQIDHGLQCGGYGPVVLSVQLWSEWTMLQILFWVVQEFQWSIQKRPVTPCPPVWTSCNWLWPLNDHFLCLFSTWSNRRRRCEFGFKDSRQSIGVLVIPLFANSLHFLLLVAPVGLDLLLRQR